MTLPKITNQQQAILRLLYTHRFLDRTHIQALLKHKDKRRIIAWLKDLREKQYVAWIYNPDDFTLKTKPAIYYLGLNGVRCLRQLNAYPKAELNKRYKDASRSQAYISRSLLVAECCITLNAQTTKNTHYSYITEADYIDPQSDRHFLNELRPNLCFTKQDGLSQINYLLEVFDATTPRYMVKKRLKDYVEFLDDGEWEHKTGESEPPIVLVACPTTADLIYCKRRTRKLLEDLSIDGHIHIRFATVEKLKLQGVTGIIWEEIEIES
jgi:hypothetical protein